MFKVRINEENFDFGGITKEEYLEFFGYKNPVKIGENVYEVTEIGSELPAVSIMPEYANA